MLGNLEVIFVVLRGDGMLAWLILFANWVQFETFWLKSYTAQIEDSGSFATDLVGVRSVS